MFVGGLSELMYATFLARYLNKLADGVPALLGKMVLLTVPVGEFTFSKQIIHTF